MSSNKSTSSTKKRRQEAVDRYRTPQRQILHPLHIPSPTSRQRDTATKNTLDYIKSTNSINNNTAGSVNSTNNNNTITTTAVVRQGEEQHSHTTSSNSVRGARRRGGGRLRTTSSSNSRSRRRQREEEEVEVEEASLEEGKPDNEVVVGNDNDSDRVRNEQAQLDPFSHYNPLHPSYRRLSEDTITTITSGEHTMTGMPTATSTGLGARRPRSFYQHQEYYDHLLWAPRKSKSLQPSEDFNINNNDNNINIFATMMTPSKDTTMMGSSNGNALVFSSCSEDEEQQCLAHYSPQPLLPYSKAVTATDNINNNINGDGINNSVDDEDEVGGISPQPSAPPSVRLFPAPMMVAPPGECSNSLQYNNNTNNSNNSNNSNNTMVNVPHGSTTINTINKLLNPCNYSNSHYSGVFNSANYTNTTTTTTTGNNKWVGYTPVSSTCGCSSSSAPRGASMSASASTRPSTCPPSLEATMTKMPAPYYRVASPPAAATSALLNNNIDFYNNNKNRNDLKKSSTSTNDTTTTTSIARQLYFSDNDEEEVIIDRKSTHSNTTIPTNTNITTHNSINNRNNNNSSSIGMDEKCWAAQVSQWESRAAAFFQQLDQRPLRTD